MDCDKCSCYLMTVYSSPCISVLKDLVTCMSVAFGLPGKTADDLFCYGVFCKDETYANFTEWPADPSFEVPSALTDSCSTESSRSAYVNGVIEGIMCRGDERPAWMTYVEEESSECGAAPSTFLRISAREGRYQCMADLLVDYLYSPNRMITMLD